ncbi:polyribonucleotide nucleotidyltransferase [Candidatus Uhrbacteria bacterium]|nr:polyribonucleotide nucleotidyltransferase [Candidatus Uhrbacteria bacterium]
MSVQTFETEWAGRTLKIETGRFAHQADASCTVQYGDTVVLATAVMSKETRPGMHFFPLMVEFEEKYSAAGKIKGSRFMKKEGRPSDQAVLSGRMIDRGIRPLFDNSIRNDIQVIVSVLSFDEENDPDVLGIIGSACVLHMSQIPWNGPIAGSRVGRVNDEFVLNPTYAVREESSMDLVVSGTTDRLLMVEADAKQLSDDLMGDAIEFGLKSLAPVMELLEKVKATVGSEKIDPATLAPETDEEKAARANVEKLSLPLIASGTEKYFFGDPLARKVDRGVARAKIEADLVEALLSQGVDKDHLSYGTSMIYSEVENVISAQILKNDRRVDGRAILDVRALEADTGILPRTHGSALFSRGETQILSTVTLAGPGAQQIVDTMEMDVKIHYMHHYTFPPFSVGEAKPMRGPGRREIGHGALAEKALIPVLPAIADFPYTIRVTSDTMGSNGSSSMGSVCGSTLSLMDAGVPILAPVAGVAIGLASVPDMSEWKVFTDLQDLEDGQGGMDFKVAGTREGVTAVQLDTKTIGIDMAIVREALVQGKACRNKILDVIEAEIKTPRAELSAYSPRIEALKINPEKIRDVIGPGGKMINEIIKETGVDIDIEDDGTVTITSKEAEGMRQAIAWVQSLVEEVEVGKTYKGKVTRLMDFGAFVEVLPKQEGLVHVSELAPWRVEKVGDIVKEGQIIFVKIVEIDAMGRINLSMKKAEGNVYPEPPKGAASKPTSGGSGPTGSKPPYKPRPPQDKK